MSVQSIHIDSEHNDRYRQLLLLLSSSRERRKRQRSVIEGLKALEAFESLRSRHHAARHDVFIARPGLQDKVLMAALARFDSPVLVLPVALFRRASQVASSIGPVAVIDTPRPELPAQFAAETVYLDRVQDPGNIGTILRTCAAAGVSQVVTSRAAAFCWAPKVLRAAMGAHFALSIFEGVEPPEWQARLAPSLARRAMVAPSADVHPQDLFGADLRAPAAWIFGSEGEGIRDELMAAATQRLTIAQQPQVESLNVAAAVAICLFEARRQRHYSSI